MFCWDKFICYILLLIFIALFIIPTAFWKSSFECLALNAYGVVETVFYTACGILRFVWDVVLASSVEVWQQNPILRRTRVFRPVQIFRLLCHLTYFFKMFCCTLWIVFCIKVMWNPPDALNSQNWIVNNRMQFGCCIYTSHFCWQFNCPVKSSFPYTHISRLLIFSITFLGGDTVFQNLYDFLSYVEQKEDILKNIPLVFDFIYTKIIGSTNPLTFFTVMSPGKYLEAVVISSCYICLHRHTRMNIHLHS